MAIFCAAADVAVDNLLFYLLMFGITHVGNSDGVAFEKNKILFVDKSLWRQRRSIFSHVTFDTDYTIAHGFNEIR